MCAIMQCTCVNVAVPAETVTHENVLEAYTDVYHVETPDWLKEAYVE